MKIDKIFGKIYTILTQKPCIKILKKNGMKVGKNFSVQTDSISVILPNVKIGNNVIIGANSVVCKDIENGVVVAGNPAKIINTIDKYISKYRNISDELKFDKSYTINSMKKEIIKEKLNNIGLIE